MVTWIWDVKLNGGWNISVHVWSPPWNCLNYCGLQQSTSLGSSWPFYHKFLNGMTCSSLGQLLPQHFWNKDTEEMTYCHDPVKMEWIFTHADPFSNLVLTFHPLIRCTSKWNPRQHYLCLWISPTSVTCQLGTS